jgi:hypothetical protein
MSDNNSPDKAPAASPATSPVAPAVPAKDEARAATSGTRRTKAAAAPTHYQIVRGQVGPHAEGVVVGADVFQGVDVQRLLDLGVITAAEAPKPASETDGAE